MSLDRFRNLQRQKVELHPRFNLLLGRNGQGKTNFLEAVGYLGTLRSFRSAGRSEMIGRGQEMCHVSGDVLSGGSERRVAFTLTRKERVQFLDDRKVGSPESYLQALKVIHFIPEDVSLVSGSPSWRRKVVDRAVFDVSPHYASEYRRYLAALRQRNALLRRGRAARGEMEGWNRTLASTGAALVRRRFDLLLAINPLMDDLGRRLGLDDGLRLVYQPSFPLTPGVEDSGAVTSRPAAGAGLEDIEKGIGEGLTETAAREGRAGHTLVGPHRDNIAFVTRAQGQDHDLSRFGSQGQKRGAVLIFKMALASLVADARGDWPIVLLDDVASELDKTRREALGRLVREMDAQFFISTTGEEYMFLPAEEGRIWNVADGRLRLLEGGLTAQADKA
ncbi:MAG: DNA replication and repair protein RecF [bacterium]|nr:MAG: DNA replication and repair protein RecF [bacterium]